MANPWPLVGLKGKKHLQGGSRPSLALRHTTASLLFTAGADTVAVQKLMRHRDLRMTIGTYGHLSPVYSPRRWIVCAFFQGHPLPPRS